MLTIQPNEYNVFHSSIQLPKLNNSFQIEVLKELSENTDLNPFITILVQFGSNQPEASIELI